MSKVKRGAFVQLLSSYSNTLFVIISGLLFVPLYFKYFPLGVYGAWLATGNISNLLFLFEGGITIVISQRIAVLFAKGDFTEFSKAVSSGLLIMFVVAFTIALVGLILSPLIPSWINVENKYSQQLSHSFLLASIASAVAILNSSLNHINKAWHLNAIPATAAFVASLFGLASIYISLVVFDQGLVSLGVGALVRSCVVFLVTASYTFSVWVRKSYPPLQLDRKYTFEILKKSLPLIGTNLMGLVSNNSKELALAVLVNPAAVAVLSITGRLFSLVSTIVNPISLSVFTGLASISVDESKFKKWAKDLLSFYNLFSGLMYAIALTVNAVFISAWVGIDKYGGLILSILLCLSQWLISKANMYITILNAKGIFSKTAQILAFDLMARLTFFGFIFLLNIPFKMITFPLIEVLGMMFTVSFLHYISCVRIFEKNQRLIQSLFGYLPKMIYYICLSLVLYYLTNKIRIDDVNKWVHAIMVTSIVLAAFAFVSLIKRSDYVVIKNVSSNIR